MIEPNRDERPRPSTAPSTSSVLWAEWRRGLKDLQDVVLRAFPDSAPGRDEPGTVANPPVTEVHHDRRVETDPFEVARGRALGRTLDRTKEPEISP